MLGGAELAVMQYLHSCVYEEVSLSVLRKLRESLTAAGAARRAGLPYASQRSSSWSLMMDMAPDKPVAPRLLTRLLELCHADWAYMERALRRLPDCRLPLQSVLFSLIQDTLPIFRKPVHPQSVSPLLSAQDRDALERQFNDAVTSRLFNSSKIPSSQPCDCTYEPLWSRMRTRGIGTTIS